MFRRRDWTLFPQVVEAGEGLCLLPAGGLFRPDGSLVLEGEDAALCERVLPGLGRRLGQKVRGLPKPYGLATLSEPWGRIGVFQVSSGSLREGGSLVLLAYSLALLEPLLRENPREQAHLSLRLPEGALSLENALIVAERVLWGVSAQVVVYT